MLQRMHFEDRDSWLAGRQNGLGASEAAAVVGFSPWATPVELWKLKLGMTDPKDLSGNDAVSQGVMMEPILRDFFAATHERGEQFSYTVKHYPYDILFQKERPWLFATLDGELLRHKICSAQPKYGILEIKTATPRGKAGWDKWSNGNMPMNYYCQTLHALLATGWDFVILFAALYSMNGDITLRQYEIERTDVQEDLNWLLAEETKFWGYVQRREMPPIPLML